MVETVCTCLQIRTAVCWVRPRAGCVHTAEHRQSHVDHVAGRIAKIGIFRALKSNELSGHDFVKVPVDRVVVVEVLSLVKCREVIDSNRCRPSQTSPKVPGKGMNAGGGFGLGRGEHEIKPQQCDPPPTHADRGPRAESLALLQTTTPDVEVKGALSPGGVAVGQNQVAIKSRKWCPCLLWRGAKAQDHEGPEQVDGVGEVGFELLRLHRKDNLLPCSFPVTQEALQNSPDMVGGAEVQGPEVSAEGNVAELLVEGQHQPRFINRCMRPANCQGQPAPQHLELALNAVDARLGHGHEKGLRRVSPCQRCRIYSRILSPIDHPCAAVAVHCDHTAVNSTRLAQACTAGTALKSRR